MVFGVLKRVSKISDFSACKKRLENVPVVLNFFGKKTKRFAKQMLSDVINALACVYCYFLRVELNA